MKSNHLQVGDWHCSGCHQTFPPNANHACGDQQKDICYWPDRCPAKPSKEPQASIGNSEPTHRETPEAIGNETDWIECNHCFDGEHDKCVHSACECICAARKLRPAPQFDLDKFLEEAPKIGEILDRKYTPEPTIESIVKTFDATFSRNIGEFCPQALLDDLKSFLKDSLESYGKQEREKGRVEILESLESLVAQNYDDPYPLAKKKK